MTKRICSGCAFQPTLACVDVDAFTRYQCRASDFAVYPDPMYPVLGLAEEAGEVVGKFAKALRAGTKVDKEYVAKELGDVLWNVAMIAEDLGLSLSVIAGDNLRKLEDRQARSVLKGEGDDR